MGYFSRMKTSCLKRWLTGGAVAALSVGGLHAETPAPVQSFPLRESTGLVGPKVKAEAVKYLGRECVRITVDGEDNEGLALLPGTDFQDGVIEVDIALKSTTPPGVRYPGFVGIAFRARPDATHYDLFYLRPGNADSPDQPQRNHAVQYAAEPGFGWYRLRREWPSVYESHADLAMETWTKVRIEVAGRAAKLFLNGSAKPSLVVDGLKGEDLHGAVGLWSFTNEEAYFADVRITPAAAPALKNGSDVAGSLGDAVFQRRGRDGRGDGIAPRRRQGHGNMVRSPRRGPPDHRSGQCVPGRLDRRRFRQGTDARGRTFRRRVGRQTEGVSAQAGISASGRGS